MERRQKLRSNQFERGLIITGERLTNGRQNGLFTAATEGRGKIVLRKR
jgi:hypothetical protein